MRVLVADDDPDILEAIELILVAHEFEVKGISNGDEVIKSTESYHPDLIILDLLLSGSDGRIICQSLKSAESSKHIPIILVSAHPAAKTSAMEAGAEGFVAKPFAIDDLVGEANRLVSAKKS